MPRYSRPSYTSIGYPSWPPGVKAIVIACVITFLFQRFIAPESFTQLFGLVPSEVLYHGHVWQLVTYIFLHDTGNLMHLLFNMLGLWMFGSDLELLWGTKRFMRFFFVCGIGAGIIFTLLSRSDIPTIGASGAVYGVLLAFGVLFPDRIIYYIIFPIRAKYFVMIMGALAFYSSIGTRNSGVAHVAHLGGMACGYLYLRSQGMMRSRPGRGVRSLRGWYDEWKRKRMRRKFEVYYNERHKKDDDNKWGRWKN